MGCERWEVERYLYLILAREGSTAVLGRGLELARVADMMPDAFTHAVPYSRCHRRRMVWLIKRGLSRSVVSSLRACDVMCNGRGLLQSLLEYSPCCWLEVVF